MDTVDKKKMYIKGYIDSDIDNYINIVEEIKRIRIEKNTIIL